jgi:hypothetical protein
MDQRRRVMELRNDIHIVNRCRIHHLSGAELEDTGIDMEGRHRTQRARKLLSMTKARKHISGPRRTFHLVRQDSTARHIGILSFRILQDLKKPWQTSPSLGGIFRTSGSYKYEQHHK